MGFLDFLKKSELIKIKEFENTIIDLKNENENLKNELSRFTEIVDLENYIKEQNDKIQLNLENLDIEILGKRNKLDDLNEKYVTSLSTYKNLKSKVSLYENILDLADYGLYEPIYDFERSDKYRTEQNFIREKQKICIQTGTAAICSTRWTIDGSTAKGDAATKKNIRLILRAFNGECDSLLSKVKWNNIIQIQERVNKSFDALNKLGSNNHISITNEYRSLKIQEITLEYEFLAKKQEEKEEARAIQEELREEERAKREYEKAQKDAEKEELFYQKALEKVRKELSNDNSDVLKEQISKLEKELEEARLKKERALSMAQQTKRGHVYVISNIGSFGENVFKIGMTRRLEPLDRVRELGDASVPFKFDVHALIYSDEARTLENNLHKAFADRALNQFNRRREFFNVTLEEIKNKIFELGFEAEFNTVAEAMEYRESIILKEKSNFELVEVAEEEFPSSIL